MHVLEGTSLLMSKTMSKNTSVQENPRDLWQEI